MTRHVPDMRYEEIRREVLPDGFLQQHVLRGTAPDGSALEVPAILRIYCTDGTITAARGVPRHGPDVGAEREGSAPYATWPTISAGCSGATTPPAFSSVMARTSPVRSRRTS